MPDTREATSDSSTSAVGHRDRKLDSEDLQDLKNLEILNKVLIAESRGNELPIEPSGLRKNMMILFLCHRQVIAPIEQAMQTESGKKCSMPPKKLSLAKQRKDVATCARPANCTKLFASMIATGCNRSFQNHLRPEIGGYLVSNKHVQNSGPSISQCTFLNNSSPLRSRHHK